MKIAITGGTGFVGTHLAEQLSRHGHDVVAIARGKRPGSAVVAADVSDAESLERAFAGCDAVAHCAGINREIGAQTYQRVHIDGTRNVIAAARRAGVRKVVMLSFLRARPDCGSAYHESKWEAEEMVRASGLEFTIFKAGMIYGRGDHMLDHLSHIIHTIPLFGAVGFRERSIRPLPVEDLVDAFEVALTTHRLNGKTVAITGAEELRLTDAVRRVAQVLGKRVLMFPLPVWTHYILAWLFELTMKVPLTAIAQVRILSEGVTEAAPWADELPAELAPRRMFTPEQIKKGLPPPGPFTLRDLRLWR